MAFHLDPRAKTLMALLWTVVLSTAESIPVLMIGMMPVLLIVWCSGQQPAFLRWLRLIALMITGWMIIALLTLDRQTALTVGLRILALSSIFFVFLRTTTPEDLGGAWQQTGAPFPLIFLLTTSLQYVQVMEQRIQHIIAAQRARGIPLEPGWQALRYYPALLIPLLVQSLVSAGHLAAAMEARGFGRAGRSQFLTYHWRLRDWLAIGMTGIAAWFLFWLRF
ncbi:energy-coupling factor transporter transmembrane component T family protein [Chloroflexus sp.]|uniref:energy-coupling factor transporter transmembrane component T family protein n=1 Tax=Chloroflexus sp. TaxID=1904827 RepID=UPI00404B7D20